MSANDPWENLATGNEHLAFTYSKDHCSSLTGLSGFVKVADIAWIREFGENEGCKIACHDPVARKVTMRIVQQSMDEILEQLGQSCPTHAQALQNGSLPEQALDKSHFICGTFSKDDDLPTGNRILFRLTGPELIRQSRENKAESVIIFELAEESYKFTLQQSPGQLFRLSGRHLPMTPAQRRDAAPGGPSINS